MGVIAKNSHKKFYFYDKFKVRLTGRIIYFVVFIFTFSYSVYSTSIKFIKEIEISSGKSKEETLLKIVDVTADRKGNIFVLDQGDNRIKKFSSDGHFIKSGGGKGEGPGELRDPSHINLDDVGGVYVIEVVGGRLVEFDNFLNFIKQIKLQTPRACSDIFIYSDMFICCHNVVLVIGDKYFYIFSKDGKPQRWDSC